MTLTFTHTLFVNVIWSLLLLFVVLHCCFVLFVLSYFVLLLVWVFGCLVGWVFFFKSGRVISADVTRSKLEKIPKLKSICAVRLPQISVYTEHSVLR